MKHDDVPIHNRAIDRNVGRGGIRNFLHEGPQARQSVTNIRIVLHERLGKEPINRGGISISKNPDHRLLGCRT